MLLPLPLPRTVRLPRAARSRPAARRCRAGAAQPARGSAAWSGLDRQGRPIYCGCPATARRSQAEAVSGLIDTPPMRRPCAIRRLGRRLHPVPAGEVMAMALRVVSPGRRHPPTGWRRAEPLPESPHDRSPPAGARRPGRQRSRARTGGPGAAPASARRDARHGRRRRCWFRRSCRRAAIRHPRSGTSRPDPVPGSGRPPPRPCATRWRRANSPSPAGWRHRLRQDRGLPGGGRGMPAAGPAGAGAAAGDRAVLAMAGALRAPLRRGARRCGIPT